MIFFPSHYLAFFHFPQTYFHQKKRLTACIAECAPHSDKVNDQQTSFLISRGALIYERIHTNQLAAFQVYEHLAKRFKLFLFSRDPLFNITSVWSQIFTALLTRERVIVIYYTRSPAVSSSFHDSHIRTHVSFFYSRLFNRKKIIVPLFHRLALTRPIYIYF